MDEMILQVRHLSKSFGKHEVLRDIDFTVNRGDVTSIIGASGSGKSTLLRCVNLLETPTSGEITFHGENILTRKGGAAAYRTKVGMVFQSFNLFNNMSVLDNCTVGQIKVLKKSAAEAKELAMKYLTKVGMAPYINAKPRQLSGGQKQRVAIARALAMDQMCIRDSLKGVEDGVVLKGSGNDVGLSPRLSPTGGGENGLVVRLAAPRGKVDLLRPAVEAVRHGLPGLCQGFSGLLAQGVQGGGIAVCFP